MSAIQVEVKNGKAYIASPYNVEFVRRIKLSGGKWSAASKRWYVPEPALPGIIYHNGKWCAPTEHLTYRDHAVWCDTIFKE